MKITRREFILEDHMELIPEQEIARKKVRTKKRKAFPKVRRVAGSAVFKEIASEKYVVESYTYKKEGIKITRVYKKDVDISDEFCTRTINKFINQKIEVTR